MLYRRGIVTFELRELVAEVQSLDETRGRGTIQPVVQGMTINAGKGPSSPCGKVFIRVDHGRYRLAGPSEQGVPLPAVRVARSTRRGPTGSADLRTRLEELTADFDRCVEAYDSAVPFTRSGQYEFHRLTIERRKLLGSVDAAVHDDTFIELLHSTLKAWGIGRRRSRLAPLPAFARTLQEHVPELLVLEPLALEGPGLDAAVVAERIDGLVSDLAVVTNVSRIVAGTKTLHHLLPDLVPPMDRAWTGTFFGWSNLDPQTNQSRTLALAFISLANVARVTRPSRLVGSGWRTSPAKIVDNAVIGYCKLHHIESRNASPKSSRAANSQ